MSTFERMESKLFADRPTPAPTPAPGPGGWHLALSPLLACPIGTAQDSQGTNWVGALNQVRGCSPSPGDNRWRMKAGIARSTGKLATALITFSGLAKGN